MYKRSLKHLYQTKSVAEYKLIRVYRLDSTSSMGSVYLQFAADSKRSADDSHDYELISNFIMFPVIPRRIYSAIADNTKLNYRSRGWRTGGGGGC